MTEEDYELHDYEKVQEEYEGQSICKDAAKEIANLRAEKAALKEQVAQLEADNSHAGLFYEKQLTTLQSESDALVDAFKEIVYSRPLVDQQIQLEILAALAAFKGAYNGKS